MNNPDEYMEKLLDFQKAEAAKRDELELSVSFTRQASRFLFQKTISCFIAFFIVYPIFFFTNETLRHASLSTHLLLILGFLFVILLLIADDMNNSSNVKKIKITPRELTLTRGIKETSILWSDLKSVTLRKAKDNLYSLKIKNRFWPVKFSLAGFSGAEHDDIIAIINLSLPKHCKIKIKSL